MEQNLSSSNRGSTNMSAACNTQGMYILITKVYEQNSEHFMGYFSDDNLMLLDYKTWSLLHNPINAFHLQTTVMLHH